jgi:hypothetical protein
MALDLKSIKKAALDQGWVEDVTSAGHPRFTPPDKTQRPCTYAGTPGDQRGIRNFLGCMKRSGLLWPAPKKKGMNDE